MNIEYWILNIEYWILMCTNGIKTPAICVWSRIVTFWDWVEIFILYLVRSRSWLIMSLAALGTQLNTTSKSHRNLIRFNLIKSRLSLTKPSLNLIKPRFGLIISHLNLIKPRFGLKKPSLNLIKPRFSLIISPLNLIISRVDSWQCI